MGKEDNARCPANVLCGCSRCWEDLVALRLTVHTAGGIIPAPSVQDDELVDLKWRRQEVSAEVAGESKPWSSKMGQMFKSRFNGGKREEEY